MSFLNEHPFAVEAFFKKSTVLTFALPKEELQAMLPQRLQVDAFEDKWGFLAVAMVQTEGLRPKGFPRWMGNDFFLTGYRVFVQYRHSNGKRLRGLYILKSETDKIKMKIFGNFFTQYHYSTIDFQRSEQGGIETFSSKKGELLIKIQQDHAEPALPTRSPFSSWKEARRFAGPLPFTFTWNEKEQKMLIIEGVRENWSPAPIQVLEAKVGQLKKWDLGHAVLANAFEIKDIPYYWKKASKDQWK